MSENEHEPLNFLICDLCRSGAEILEVAGFVRGIYHGLIDNSYLDREIGRIEGCLAEVRQSLDDYKRAARTKRKFFTRAEYESAPRNELKADQDELMAALVGLVKMTVNPYDGGEFEAGELPALDEARAAIAKATAP